MQTRWAPPSTRVWSGVQSGAGQTYVEIAARRVRIWANDVRLGDQLFRRGGIEARQADRERNVQAEALPVITRTDPHRRGNGAVVGDLRLALTGDILDGAEEACRIAGS